MFEWTDEEFRKFKNERKDDQVGKQKTFFIYNIAEF